MYLYHFLMTPTSQLYLLLFNSDFIRYDGHPVNHFGVLKFHYKDHLNEYALPIAY